MTVAARWNRQSLPRLRRGVQIAPADAGRWQVRWDFDEVLFLSGGNCGLVLPWLLPRLDGTHPLAELETRAADAGTAEAFLELFECLASLHFLVDAAATGAEVNSELTDALQSLGLDPSDPLRKVAGTQVLVVGCSPLAARIAASIRSQGFVHVDLAGLDHPLPDGAFVVAVETDVPPRSLERINDWAQATRQPFLLVGAWNRRLLVGPIFVPGETACYACYRKRLDSHRAHHEAYRLLDTWRRTQSQPASSEPLQPALAALTAAHVALEVFHFVAGIVAARTVGRVLVYHPVEAELTVETVLRIPWCPHCTTVAPQPSGADTLSAQPVAP